MTDEAPTRTDPTTERMRQETGHDCIACPIRVRDLMATAHNALGEWGAIADGTNADWSRLHRKMAELRRSLDQIQPVSDAHFEALNGLAATLAPSLLPRSPTPGSKEGRCRPRCSAGSDGAASARVATDPGPSGRSAPKRSAGGNESGDS